MSGLGFEHHDSQLHLLEPALLLDRLEQLVVVEVAFAEVPAGDDTGDELAVDHLVVLDVLHGPGQQPVERAPVALHRPKREDLLREVLGRLLAVEPRQLPFRERGGL